MYVRRVGFQLTAVSHQRSVTFHGIQREMLLYRMQSLALRFYSSVVGQCRSHAKVPGSMTPDGGSQGFSSNASHFAYFL